MSLPLPMMLSHSEFCFLVLAGIFYTTQSKSTGWQKFYKYVLHYCFVILYLHYCTGLWVSYIQRPSKLYSFITRYLLLASLLLFCISLDLKAFSQTGSQSSDCFLSGSLELSSVDRFHYGSYRISFPVHCHVLHQSFGRGYYHRRILDRRRRESNRYQRNFQSA